VKSLLKQLVPSAVRNRLREFRWPPGIVPWLPGSSRLFGPPRHWQLLRDYFATQAAGALREVLPAQRLTPPQPEVIGEISPRFLRYTAETVPPGHVFSLQQARVLGPEGWVVTANDTFLLDAGFEANGPEKKIGDYQIFFSRKWEARPLRRLPGRCLSLASDYAIGGFGHFIHDSLTRLLLVERAGLDLQSFDWIYLPRPETVVAKQLTDTLGIDPSRLLGYDPQHDLACDDLTASQYPGVPGHIAPVYGEFLRRRFAPAPRRRNRRVYLSRTGFRRNFSNRDEIEAILRTHGFEEVQAHVDPETLQKCAEAECVVSIEGANFFNAFACPAGTKVLVIFPDRLPHSVPYALSLAQACGLQAFVMSGATVGPADLDGGTADLHVDPLVFQQALGRLGAH